MKGLNAQQTLLATLPILFVLLGLVGALIFFPKQNLDNRSRASEVKPTPSTVTLPITVTPKPTKTIVPETACTDLYMPVCGNNNVTYSNSCEANKAGVAVSTQGACKPAKTK